MMEDWQGSDSLQQSDDSLQQTGTRRMSGHALDMVRALCMQAALSDPRRWHAAMRHLHGVVCSWSPLEFHSTHFECSAGIPLTA